MIIIKRLIFSVLLLFVFFSGCVSVESYDYKFDVELYEWYLYEFDYQIKSDVVKFDFIDVGNIDFINNYESKNIGIVDINFYESYESNNYIEFEGKVGNSGHGDKIVSILGKCYLYGMDLMNEDELIDALEWMRSRDVKYVNFSAGSEVVTMKVYEWLNKNKDMVLVSSAGNDKKLLFPAGLFNVIGVGAYDENKKIYSWSARDDVYRYGEYDGGVGTSFSCPRYCDFAYDNGIGVDDLLLNGWTVVIDTKEGRNWFNNVSVGDVLMRDIFAYDVFCLLDRDGNGYLSKGDLYGEGFGNNVIRVYYYK